MRRPLSAVIAAWLLLAVHTAAAAPASIPIEAWVDVDASGRITAVEWTREIPDVLQAAAGEGLRELQLRPATRDGSAVSGRTSLKGSLTLVEDGADYRIAFSALRAGPRVVRLRPPRYPPSALQGRARGATVVAEFTVGPDGEVSDIRTHAAAGRLAFEQRVREFLPEWRFEPEHVDGVAVATRMCIPFDFRLASDRSPPPADPALCGVERLAPTVSDQSPLWDRISVVAHRGGL
jgi:TonB family protein